MQQDYIKKIANARDAAVAMQMSAVKLSAVLSKILEELKQGNTYLAEHAVEFDKSLLLIGASSNALFRALEQLSGGSNE